MAIIKKKYILNENIKQLLNSNKIKKETISQFYTSIKLCKEIRFRKVDNGYFKTIRTGSNVRKNIINKKISKKSYQNAKENKIGKTLKKTRHTLKIDGQKYAIDQYKKHLQNLNLLEVTFNSTEKAENFNIPTKLKIYINTEVSKDKRFRNKNLALLGNPNKKKYDLYSIFKEIDKESLVSLDSVIFKEMPVGDAIRIILYKLFRSMELDKENLIQNNDIYALSNFRRNIKKSKVILSEFKYLFEKEIFKRVYQHLTMVEKSIFIDKDINIIKHNMHILETIFDDKDIVIFLKEMDEKIEYKKHKVTKFLQTREFNIIFNQYYLLIKEPNNINKQNYDSSSIQKESKRLISKRFKKSKKLINKYDKCYDINGYKKIKSSLFKLSVLLDEFQFFYKKDKYNKMSKIIKKADEVISSYIEISRESLIIKSYIKDSSTTLQKQNKLIEKVKIKRKESEKQININIEKKLRLLKKSKVLFNS